MRYMRSLVIVSVFCAFAAAPLAPAAFIGGIESFNGTTKDAATWEERNGAGISQNDLLHLDVDGGIPGITQADYNTISQTVGVGEKVRVTVTPLSANSSGAAALILTTNSQGTAVRPLDDSRYLAVFYGNSNDAILALTKDQATETNAPISNGDHPNNVGYIYEIERVSSTSASMRVFLADGVTQLGSTITPTFAGVPDNLTIALYANQINVTFDEVTITAVPEPASLAGLAMAALLIRRRSRG